MISILIPIYNRKVTTLVEALYDQCMALEIEFEIICYDDCSQEKYRKVNRVLGQKVGISYMDLSQNLGRAKIRNWLGKNARFDHIIFLDCDSGIERKSFIKRYLESKDKADVVYGGTSYSKRKPGISKRLHWKYGTKVEAQSVSERNKAPYLNFRSNNFMIRRDVFLKNKFDESITTYGYEDSLIGEELKLQKYTILHIDNPAVHLGLEKTSVYLKKTRMAINNLYQLEKDKGLRTRLIDFYHKMDHWGLLPLFRWWAARVDFESKLQKENPSILLFQLYKLFLLDKAKK